MPKLKLAVLGSTRGSSMQALIEAIEHQALDAQIDLVLSNKADALILRRAEQAKLRAQFIAARDQADFEQQLAALLAELEIDLLLLIGYMRILSPIFVQEWANKIINVHPSLLPDFAGLCDLAVHEAVLARGQRFSGCTVHYVSEEVDKGAILMQRRCELAADESALSLKAKIQALEGRALVDVVRSLSLSHKH